MVRVGVIGGAHGVRGEVRIRSFTAEPGDIAAYGDLFDESGERRFRVRLTGTVKGAHIARIDGIDDRTAAERLGGLGLFVPRAALPEPEPGDYYHADLIGLRAELIGSDAAGREARPLGEVIAVNDFGAGPILEIAAPGRAAVMVPFTAAVVPWIDMEGGRVGIEAVPGLFSDGRDDEANDAGGLAGHAPHEAGR